MSVYPQTFQTFDIVSNLPLGSSGLARPPGSARTVPAFLQRDFCILTNRRLLSSGAAADERNVHLHDAARKLRRHFDPVLQTFSDAQEDARLAQFQEAQRIEETIRRQDAMPPCVRLRPTAFHDIVSNEAASESARVWLDGLAVHRSAFPAQRVAREAELAARDQETETREETRKLRKINFQRFAEQLQRGFDIVSNADFAFNTLHPSVAPKLPQVRPHTSLVQRLQLNSTRSVVTSSPLLTKRTARSAHIPRLRM